MGNMASCADFARRSSYHVTDVAARNTPSRKSSIEAADDSAYSSHVGFRGVFRPRSTLARPVRLTKAELAAERAEADAQAAAFEAQRYDDPSNGSHVNAGGHRRSLMTPCKKTSRLSDGRTIRMPAKFRLSRRQNASRAEHDDALRSMASSAREHGGEGQDGPDGERPDEHNQVAAAAAAKIKISPTDTPSSITLRAAAAAAAAAAAEARSNKPKPSNLPTKTASKEGISFPTYHLPGSQGPTTVDKAFRNASSDTSSSMESLEERYADIEDENEENTEPASSGANPPPFSLVGSNLRSRSVRPESAMRHGGAPTAAAAAAALPGPRSSILPKKKSFTAGRRRRRTVAAQPAAVVGAATSPQVPKQFPAPLRPKNGRMEGGPHSPPVKEDKGVAPKIATTRPIGSQQVSFAPIASVTSRTEEAPVLKRQQVVPEAMASKKADRVESVNGRGFSNRPSTTVVAADSSADPTELAAAMFTQAVNPESGRIRRESGMVGSSGALSQTSGGGSWGGMQVSSTSQASASASESNEGRRSRAFVNSLSFYEQREMESQIDHERLVKIGL